MPLLNVQFHSDVLGVGSAVSVILPQETTSQIGLSGIRGAGLPRVLYLLHGWSDDHTTWTRRTSIERYASEYGIAVVMPAVGLSYYCDMAYGPKYWSYLSEELPALVQQWFKVSESPDDTFVAGLSMGGYGAIKLALRKPGSFAGAASLSGALDVATHFKERLDDQGVKTIFGNRIEGTPNDLMVLAEQLAESKNSCPPLYLCCGNADYLLPSNIAFRNHALRLGLPVDYEEQPGSHDWEFWDRMIQKVLNRFFAKP